jgi:pimeloyl-ACP methyl ester carboxylesterase
MNDPMVPVPIPAQVAAKEGIAELPDTRLGYWDTGGGEPVVFLHPASGSALVWLYQQPVFAKAGYRVIAYSRRNYYNSDSAPAANPGTGSEDLQNVMEFLGVDKFHIVASAAGGTVATDYAFSHPERLLSLTISSNNLAATEGYIAEAAARVLDLPGWTELPRWFRELGPSYRGANPQGVALWTELVEKSETGRGAKQKLVNVVTPERLETLRVRTLLMTGAADLFTPPSIMRMIARHVPNHELVIVPECGHAIYWEQPEIFNRTVLDFIGRAAK